MTAHEVEALVVRLTGDASSFQKMTQQAESAAGRMAATVGRQTKEIEKFDASIGGLGRSIGGYAASLAAMAGAGGVLSTLKFGVQLAAEAEQTQIAFGTMLGSAEKGQALTRMLQDFAAATPMDMSSIQKAAKTLLQFGVAGNDILPTLKMLGDVTGGEAEKFNRAALAFGQMASTGRLMGEELNQMIETGFNPLKEMSRTTGKSMSDLKKEMEKGKISVQMVIAAFKSATAQGGQFDGLMEKMSKSTAGLFSTMKDDLNAFLRTLGDDIIQGFKLQELMQSVSAAAQEATKWWKSLDPETKRMAVTIAVATAAVAGLTLAWTVLGGAIKAALAAVLFNPVTLAIAAAVAAVVGLVNELGGLTAAWTTAKEAALAAWDWIEPIRDATKSLFGTVWEKGKEAFAALKEYALGAWESIKDSGIINWEAIRDGIVQALLVAEFTIHNFGQVAEFVWTSAKLGFVQFANEVEHFFTSTVPATLTWFTENWQDIFTDIWEFTKTVFVNMADNIAEIIASLPDLIAGNKSLADIWKPLTEGFVRASKELVLPERVQGDLERQLREEMEAQAAALNQSFEEFAAQKHGEWFFEKLIPQGEAEEDKKQALDLGSEVGKAFAAGSAKEIQKFDAALAGSAEALQRIEAFKDRMAAGDAKQAGGGEVKKFDAAPARGAEAAQREERQQVDLLRLAVGHLARIAEQPNVVVEGAGLVA